MRSRHRRIVAGTVALTIASALWLGIPQPTPRPSKLPQGVYVWSRGWTDPVRTAIDRYSGELDPFVVLGAEVAWFDGEPTVVQMPVDFDALRKVRGAVGLALRVGPFPGPFDPDDANTQFLVSLAHSLHVEALSREVELGQLQIDFDCASSKLAGYRNWVTAIRQRLAPIPVTITALPSWLEQRQFRALVEATDGYVLQVHSLERPRTIGDPMSLCDPERSLEWVQRAGLVGVPFWVALPTYGYHVAFDPHGSFLGLAAEGPTPAWPPGTRVEQLRADPAAMAGLVSALERAPPPSLQGVLWYRLPVATDRLNWAAETLDVVRRGEVPHGELIARVTSAAPGESGRLVEIELRNDGTFDVPIGSVVRVRWSGVSPLASDAIGGFDWQRESSTTRRLVPRPGLLGERLRPGEARTLAWLRFEEETEVAVEILPAGS